MSAHVLLNLLNKLEKSSKIPGLPSISIAFHNKFNTFNNAGTRMLYSIYHMQNNTKNHIFDTKTSTFCHL